MTSGDKLDALEWSNVGRCRKTAAATLAAGLIAVTLFWSWALPALIDAATARPAACAELTASECGILAQEGGW